MQRAGPESKGVVMASRLSVAAAACGAALLGACAERAPPSIREAPAEDRDRLLLQAIRDAGYLCDEILDTTAAPTGGSMWRVLCNDMLVYIASLDGADVLHIEPIPYGDPVSFPIESRDPDKESEEPRPDP